MSHLDVLADSVVSDQLGGASGATFVIVGDVFSTANWQVDLGADANTVGAGRQAGALRLELGPVALHVADVIVGLSVGSANRREISNAVNALLNGSAIAAAVESLLDLLASEGALTDVITAVNTANGLVNEGAAAGSLAALSGEEGGSSASHNTAVFVGGSVVAADSVLSVSALAEAVGNGLVVEVSASTNLNTKGAVALGAAQVSISDTVVSANGIEVGVAGARVCVGGSSESQKAGLFVLSQGISWLGRRGGGIAVVANAPSVVGLSDIS